MARQGLDTPLIAPLAKHKIRATLGLDLATAQSHNQIVSRFPQNYATTRTRQQVRCQGRSLVPPFKQCSPAPLTPEISCLFGLGQPSNCIHPETELISVRY